MPSEKPQSAHNTHSNVRKTIGSTLASMYLDKTKSKLGGFVTPAVWVYDYNKNGKKPDVGDVSIFAGSFLSGPASIVTGLFKAAVEDDLDAKLNFVRSIEPEKYREFIKPCYGYTNSPPQVSAMTIAGTGTTVWHHPIGVWVYITDVDNRPVIDYKPVNPSVVYRPDIPLKKVKTGGYVWSPHRK